MFFLEAKLLHIRHSMLDIQTFLLLSQWTLSFVISSFLYGLGFLAWWMMSGFILQVPMLLLSA